MILVLPGIVRAQKRHLDDLVPKGDFSMLPYLGIRSSVSGIRSNKIRKYMPKL